MTDAFCLLSFGGPDGPDDVLPFLRNVTRGRNVPDDRLAEVAEQYDLFGGRSPINDQNRALLSAIEAELAHREDALAVHWGNRNWTPYLTDTVREMADAGVTRAFVLATSAFSSYSGCRQYREDLAKAADEVGTEAPELHKLRLFHNHPGFLEPVADRVRDALGRCDDPDAARLVFTAHSIPLSMAATSDYEHQLRGAAQLVVELLGTPDRPWDLVYQSRSGPPQIPWLEPDVNDHLRAIVDEVDEVVVMPLGFVSDHMEVMFDLDTQAAETAAEIGLGFVRAATVGTDPRFVSMIVELIDEVRHGVPARFLGDDGPWPDPCPENHCAYSPGRPGGGRPAAVAIGDDAAGGTTGAGRPTA